MVKNAGGYSMCCNKIRCSISEIKILAHTFSKKILLKKQYLSYNLINRLIKKQEAHDWNKIVEQN